MNKKIKFLFVAGIILILFISTIAQSSINNQAEIKENIGRTQQIIVLPPPQEIDKTLEWSIHQRMSVREFSNEPILDEDLSTVLWHAYGFTDEGKRAVHMFENDDSVRIYVINSDAVYSYNPTNHSLTLYKEGNYLNKVGWQFFTKKMLISLVWNSNGNSDEYLAAAEMGEIGQNLYFATNSIGLGGVITSSIPPQIDSKVGLPEGEYGKIDFYMGYPSYDYNFTYRPMWLSLLPKIQNSTTSLTSAIVNRKESFIWNNEAPSRQQLTQILWSSYGYSYLLDHTYPEDRYNVFNITRHRTLPSACGMYPLNIYVVTEKNTYRYYPNIVDTIYSSVNGWISWPQITFLRKMVNGDIRFDVAQSSEPYISTAPLIIIPVLDLEQTKKGDRDLSDEYFRWSWYYEAGAAAHNVLLEATAWGLAGNIATIPNKDALCNLLNLDREQFEPLLAIPVG